MNLLSWLDVERVLASKTQNFVNLPDGITSIRPYEDVLEIDTIDGSDDAANTLLQDSFGNQWKPESKIIQLAYSEESTIEVIIDKEGLANNISVKPLWKDLGYISGRQLLPKDPTIFPEKTRISAFHSFKGGVGRTTSLLTWLVALIEQFNKRAHNNKNLKKLKVLIVDADLEAPGLTYLLPAHDRPPVSWIQLLEASHYPAVELDQVIKFFADEINGYTKRNGVVEICMLPAYSETESSGANMSQLMDISVRPEHLARNLNNPWQCTDILHKLGTRLKADLVLVDLRAGISELSSPLLFDPRIERFIVTTLAEQAVQGTEFILKCLSSTADNKDWQRLFGDKTLDPSVIATFITEEFKKTDRYEDSLKKLKEAYSAQYHRNNSENAADSLEILEGGFSQEMLHLGKWDDALKSIQYSPLLSVATTWANEFLASHFDQEENKLDKPASDFKNEAKKLYALSSQLVYAEKGESSQLLLTEALRNLAQRHVKTLPQVVSIGAKGAGKTFNYIQLCRKKSWKAS